ncbi:hypothetical protein WKH56_07715 [Priestia sp. SB1]|uniref:hypothetical protein n=1 Tax=Priestia sp. SB1 TaxID=3132359 RepID=UPI0031788C05
MLNFVLDHLLLIIIVCVVLFVILPFILRIASTIIKIVVIIAILGALGLFGAHFFDKSNEPIKATQEFATNTIRPAIENELSKSDFNYNPKTKKYIIQSSSFKLEGITNSNKADVVFKDKTYTIDVTFLKDFIQKQVAQQTQTN